MNANDSIAIVKTAPISVATQRAAVTKSPAKNETKTTLSHADSSFYYNCQPDFNSLCTQTADLQILNENSHLKQSVTVQATSMGDAHISSEISLPTPTPRGHSALDGFVKIEFIGIATILLMLAITKASSPTFIGEIINFFADGIKWKKLSNTTSARTSLLFLLTLAIYHITMCMFIVEATTIHYPNLLHGMGTATVACIIAYAVWNIIRIITDRTIGYAFNIDSKSKSIILYKSATCSLIGLILTPITFILPFISTANAIVLINITIAIIILATGFRVLRMAQLFMNNLSSFFYMFLYLCIVEAMPIVLLCKIAMLIANDITT